MRKFIFTSLLLVPLLAWIAVSTGQNTTPIPTTFTVGSGGDPPEEQLEGTVKLRSAYGASRIKVWNHSTRSWSSLFTPGSKLASVINATTDNPTQDPNVAFWMVLRTGWADYADAQKTRLDTTDLVSFSRQDSAYIGAAGSYFKAWSIGTFAPMAYFEFVPNDSLNDDQTFVTGDIIWDRH